MFLIGTDKSLDFDNRPFEDQEPFSQEPLSQMRLQKNCCIQSNFREPSLLASHEHTSPAILDDYCSIILLLDRFSNRKTSEECLYCQDCLHLLQEFLPDHHCPPPGLDESHRCCDFSLFFNTPQPLQFLSRKESSGKLLYDHGGGCVSHNSPTVEEHSDMLLQHKGSSSVDLDTDKLNFFYPSFKRLLRENVHPVLCSLSFISSMIKVLGKCNEEIKLNAELLHNLLLQVCRFLSLF